MDPFSQRTMTARAPSTLDAETPSHPRAPAPSFQAELERFERFIERKGLKSTRQRELILQTFLETDAHIDVEALTQKVRDKNPAIGHATVYRTMKLLTECGLAHESHFGDGMARYEHVSHKHHHDHMICLRCQAILEFESPDIEALQEAAAAANGFTILSHKLEIYGHCARCTDELRRGIKSEG